jgi:RHS repeat-associated protein
MRQVVPASRRVIILLLAVAVGVLGAVVPAARPAQAAAGDPISYAYDDAGRLVGATDPATDTARYRYDPAGNLTSIDRQPSSQAAILAFAPSHGPAGTAVTISGTGFSTTAASNVVKFNGTTATVTAATSTRLEVTVPAGATTGPITVTAPGGSATSSDPFTVAAPATPTITGFSPTIGTPGTAITITGTNFDPSAINNAVAFNRTRSKVNTAATTSLTVEVPIATGSGPISVRAPGGMAVSSDDFFIPPAPATAADVEVASRLTIGTGKPFTISTGGKIALLVLDGTAGQRISVQMTNSTISTGACTTLNGTLALLKPDGSQLSATGLCAASTFLEPVTLPSDGTYTVLVDPAGTKTGSATITAFSVVDVTGTISPGGAGVPVSITTPGQAARLTFTGTANQRVSLQMTNSTISTGACTPLNGTLAILKPDGSTLGAADFCAASTFLDAVTLPSDGTYTELVDPYAAKTASATITAHTVVDVTCTISPGGAGVQVSITTPGQNARLTFTGTANQRVSLLLSNGSFGSGACTSGRGRLAILKPDGSTLGAADMCPVTTFLDTVTLPTDGTYTVLLDLDDALTGSGTLTLYSVTDVTGPISAGSAGVPVSITTPGQNVRLTFTGTAGQRVSLSLTNGSFGSGACTSARGKLAILKPDGSTLGKADMCPTTTFVDTLTLPVDGTYTVLLDPDGALTGAGTLTLHSVTDVTGTITADGTAAAFTTTVPGQNVRYSFTASANQKVSLRLTNSTVSTGACTPLNGKLAILKPDGTTLGATDLCAASAFLDTVTLPTAGSYTVLVDPADRKTGSGTLTLYTVVDVTGTITVDGAAVPITISTVGQNARLSFAGTANQRVNLTLTASTIGGLSNCSSANGALAILKPDATTLASTSLCKPTTPLAPQTLPVDGTYTILVNPSTTNTGSANVAVATAPAGALATSTAAGTAGSPAKATPSAAQPAATPSADITSSRAPAEEVWIPEPPQRRGAPWTDPHRPGTVWAGLDPLQAARGHTAVAGQTLTLAGHPLRGVTVRIDTQQARSDASGRFLLDQVPAGHHELLIDGRTASTPGRRFGVFEVGVDLVEGETLALPYTIWMPRLDTTHTSRFASPTTGEVVITTPRIPGLEVRIPTGSTIRDTDGKVVHELGITAIPVNRPPFPLPADVQVPIYFTVQPGGAYVFPEGAQLIYPNYTHEAPGTRVNFWQYDPKDKGWHIYGKGTVTQDAKQVVPDPGVRVYEFTGAMINVPGLVPAAIAAIRDAFAAISGDPVDLGTGLLINSHTDLYLPDILPISITRTYRQSDSRSRPFGIGTNFDYGIFLHSQNQYQEADLIFPDSSKVHYVRTSPGNGISDAVFEAQDSPTAFYKSTIVFNGWGWDLKLRDGSTLVFGFNQPLQLIRDRYGNQITLTRTNGQGGNITQITSPNGLWIRLSYDTSDRITRAEDITGRVVTYTYDTGGRLIQVTGPAANNITKYAYNASHQLTTITDARDIVYLTNEYDTNGRIKKQTQADQSTYQFAYTTGGNGKVTETQVTDPRGNVRKVTFNTEGFLTSDTAAFGTPQSQTMTVERQAGTNFVTAITDQLARRTAFGYDPNGNLSSVTRLAGTAGAQTVSYTYGGPFSQVSEVTDPLNHKTTFSYDSRGSLTKVKDALDRETSYTFNYRGQPTSAKDALDHRTRFSYELGDLVAVEDPLGRTTRQYLDGAGRVGGIADPTGAASRVTYDARNQATEVTDPLGNKTSFTYDANGNLLTVKDARDKPTTYTYDQMDWVDTLKDPLGKLLRYDYDANGNLETVTSRRNKVTSYSYDPLDRLTQVKYGVAGTSAESTVDYTWDAGNRLRQIDDSAGGTITYTPDNLDRIATETSPQGSVGYGYDAADRLASMTVAGQPQVTYGYNNADQPTTITKGSQSVSVGYDSVGRPTTLNLPGGVSETYGLDDADQLTSITYKQGTTTLGDLTYGYDQVGRRTTVGGSFARIAIPDPFSSASYNDNNQLTSRAGVSYSYDDDGNLTDDGTTSYSWNARGQLTGLSRTGLSASFAYDAVGRRKSKTINGTATGYLHDGANATQELSGTTPTANLLSGGIDQWLTRTDSTGQRTYLTDALGSTVALTDPSGAVKTSYTYEPFGKTTATGETNANPQRYTGREDDGTGLYYYRARYYHPGLQRFISEDPAGYSAGDTNLYAYVGNNPTNVTDPSGENPAIAVLGSCLTGAAIGTGVSYLEQRLSGRKVNWGLGGWGGWAGARGVGGAALLGCGAGALGRGAGLLISKLLSRSATAEVASAVRFAGRDPKFRANFEEAFGPPPRAGYDAHHVLPVQFGDRLARLGIDVNDARYGTWIDRTIHQGISTEYARDWEAFLQGSPTPEQVLAFARMLAGKYGFNVHF